MRWGIAGFGWVARDYMAPAMAAAGGKVAGIADPSPLAQASAMSASIIAYDDVAMMLADANIDALYVATPNHLHRPMVEIAAAAGVSVLCEKPLAATLDDAEAMAAAVAKSGILFGTAFDQRHHPAHMALRDAIGANRIGTPTAVRIVYCCWVGPDWSAANWRADAAAAGGGAGIDLALHGLDLAQFLIGEEIVLLDMMVQRRIHSYGVEDGAMLTARTESGVLVSIHVAYNCPEALPRRRLEVVGLTGALEATDTMGQTPGGTVVLRCGTSGESAVLAFDTTLSPFTCQVSAFEAAVRGGEHDFDIKRDLWLMRLFDAAYRKALACL